MARARTLKPGFFTDAELGELPPLARLLFQGLWCLADREGRLKDRVKEIKVQVLPYDKCDVNELLNQLAEKGFIARYDTPKGACIEVVNFLEHQNPHPKEKSEELPSREIKFPAVKLNFQPCNFFNPTGNATRSPTGDSNNNKGEREKIGKGKGERERSPLWPDCEFFRMSEEEHGKAIARFTKNQLPIDLIPYCIEAVENWLSTGGSPEARRAREDDTHFRRLNAAWALRNAQDLLKVAGLSTTPISGFSALIAKLEAEEAEGDEK